MKIDKSSNFILLWILAYMSALAPLATDMYLPSMGAVQESFQTTSANTQLSITVFFVAFAFGQLLYGPISDALGRRKPLTVGILIYTLTSFACAEKQLGRGSIALYSFSTKSLATVASLFKRMIKGDFVARIPSFTAAENPPLIDL